MAKALGRLLSYALISIFLVSAVFADEKKFEFEAEDYKNYELRFSSQDNIPDARKLIGELSAKYAVESVDKYLFEIISKSLTTFSITVPSFQAILMHLIPQDKEVAKLKEHFVRDLQNQILNPQRNKLFINYPPESYKDNDISLRRLSGYAAALVEKFGQAFYKQANQAYHQYISSQSKKQLPIPYEGNQNKFEDLWSKKDLRQRLEAVKKGTANKDVHDQVDKLLITLRADLMFLEKQRKIDGKSFEIYGRDAETKSILDSFIMIEGPIPFIVGEAGSGKTALIQNFVQTLLESKYPKFSQYLSAFSDTGVMEVSARDILLVAQYSNPITVLRACRDYFEGLNNVFSRDLKEKVIVVVRDAHLLPEQTFYHISQIQKRSDHVRFLMQGESKRTNSIFQAEESLKDKYKKINTLELRDEIVSDILLENWIPKFQDYYYLKFSPKVVDLIVKSSPIMYPDLGLLNSSIRFAQDVSLFAYNDFVNSKSKNSSNRNVTVADVYRIIEQKLGLPVNPFEATKFMQFQTNLEEKLNEEVLGQTRMVHDVVQLFGDLLQDRKRNIRVGMLLGPTGVGKTEVGNAIAKLALNNKNAFLELDGNAYKDPTSMNTLTGSGEGYAGSKKGVLGEFLLNESRGANTAVILINEFEKAHEDIATKLMEFFDKGKLALGDGSVAVPKKVLVLLTSNKADAMVYPDGIDTWSQAELENHIRSFDSDKIKELFTSSQGPNDGFTLHNSITARIDRFTLAMPITKEIAPKIAEKLLSYHVRQALETYGLKVRFTDEVVRNLSLTNYNMKEGARQIVKRTELLFNTAMTEARSNKDWDLQEGSRLSLKLSKDGRYVEIYHGRKKLKVPAEVKENFNPYEDSELLEKLFSIEEELNKAVLNQKEANHSIAQAVAAHKLNPNADSALSFFLVGTSGSGKTATGKALSGVLFGSNDRVTLIPLGDIDDKSKWGKFFGVEPEYQGGKEIRVFEQALINYPNGGVVIFDEASNLGGNDPAKKDALFKKLYAITDEKEWRSPNTGKVYDLTKHIFLFTGNDGQELFAGNTTDDMRKAIYEGNKSKDKLLALLSERGIPEPFLGRMADVILSHPLMKQEILQISELLIKPVLDLYKKNGMRVKFADGFYEQFGASFFRATKGGRSVKDVANTRLKAAIDQGLLELLRQGHKMKDLSVTIDLSDNLPKVPYRPSTDWEREVNFHVVFKKGRKDLKSLNVPVTEFAPQVNLQGKRYVAATAFHEAGHAVVNDPKITGQRVGYITVVGADHFLGYVRWEELKQYSGKSFDKETLINRLAALRAGGLAQKLAGYQIDGGWSNDMEKVSRFVYDALVKYNLDPRVRGIKYDGNGKWDPTESQKELIAKISQEWIDEADRLAVKKLTENWHLVRNIVRTLLDKGNITADEHLELFDKTKAEVKRLKAAGENVTEWRPHYSLNKDAFYETLLMKKRQNQSVQPRCRLSAK
ncbi:MAG: AAA family ATPase [Bdellovibrionota bacterium]|nr:AAA family ATPase [Bdellovibrionota bacterium]